MSLDVYLHLDELVSAPEGSGIFVRVDGQTREITREEWDAAFPGREPYVVKRNDDYVPPVFQQNITHNLNTMAKEAGIYMHLWRPGEIGITKARQLVNPLRVGLETLRSDPTRFRVHNPENGWGNYEGLVRFVEEYLNACEKYPEARVEVSR